MTELFFIKKYVLPLMAKVRIFLLGLADGTAASLVLNMATFSSPWPKYCRKHGDP